MKPGGESSSITSKTNEYYVNMHADDNSTSNVICTNIISYSNMMTYDLSTLNCTSRSQCLRLSIRHNLTSLTECKTARYHMVYSDNRYMKTYCSIPYDSMSYVSYYSNH